MNALAALHPQSSPVFLDPQEAVFFPHFFSSKREPNLLQAMRQPNPYVLELGEYVHLSKVLTDIREVEPCYVLSLTTRTAFRQPVAEYYAQHFSQRFSLLSHKVMEIKTCLQEAIANAVMHGNLAIQHEPAEGEDFTRYYEQVNERLGQEHYASKRVNIYLWEQPTRFAVRVSDEGTGFSAKPPAPNASESHGRGLHIIHSLADKVWQGTDKSSLYMSFRKVG